MRDVQVLMLHCKASYPIIIIILVALKRSPIGNGVLSQISPTRQHDAVQSRKGRGALLCSITPHSTVQLVEIWMVSWTQCSLEVAEADSHPSRHRAMSTRRSSATLFSMSVVYVWVDEAPPPNTVPARPTGRNRDRVPLMSQLELILRSSA